ncbi:MAG: crossover junction endodeoxyribonuclease RuvC [Alphaproteobacteria bacterium]|nr:crossover junction endodeoxyribonuclease RuvC [Alphaproteobacteria bacterium]
MRLLGLDPGLQISGWGIIDVAGNRLRHVADGVVRTNKDWSLAERLVQLYDGLGEVIDAYNPSEAAVEETFVNKNPNSTLKLGQARGIVLLAPAKKGLPVAEYSANLIKKSVVGTGHAAKEQVQMMIKSLLPGCEIKTADAADALAVAVCHSHHRVTQKAWENAVVMAGAKK